jgi:hypothetical protein
MDFKKIDLSKNADFLKTSKFHVEILKTIEPRAHTLMHQAATSLYIISDIIS